jgi:hypothetical protein
VFIIQLLFLLALVAVIMYLAASCQAQDLAMAQLKRVWDDITLDDKVTSEELARLAAALDALSGSRGISLPSTGLPLVDAVIGAATVASAAWAQHRYTFSKVNKRRDAQRLKRGERV